VLQLLVDTSVWLDLARKRDAQALIVPLRSLKHSGQLTLLVPQLVIDEFDRNRPQAEARVAQSVADRFRELRRDLHEYADPERLNEWLDEMAHHVPLVSSMTLQNFREVSELLSNGQRLEPSAAEYERVVRRALDQQAPIHLRKNSVADVLLIELYRAHLARSDPDQRLGFVTSNHEDFSASRGDRRAPHTDLAELFDSHRSRYVYGVEGLRAVLVEDFGDEFEELVQEVRLIHEEPRTFLEILDAEQEFFDKVWHVRHLIRLEQEATGQQQPPPKDIDARATTAARAIEDRYGKENVGPWDDWHWGFANGKLSALRWVLGSEWDFLDT
jgi:PIN domain